MLIIPRYDTRIAQGKIRPFAAMINIEVDTAEPSQTEFVLFGFSFTFLIQFIQQYFSVTYRVHG